MALPLKAYSKKVGGPLQGYSKVTSGSRQHRPYTIPTGMRSDEYIRVRGDVDFEDWSWSPPSDWPFNSFERATTAASNQAYERLVGRLGDGSSFGATLTAERKETFGMLTSTLIKLAQAARSIKRLDFGSAARILGLPYRERTVTKTRYTHRRNGSRKRAVTVRDRVFALPTGREVSKTLANGWLFYSYGVKPLMQDLYNGMDVLQRPLPFEKIRGGGKSSATEVVSDNTPGYWPTRRSWSVEVSTRCSVDVQVNNPDLFLAQRMGLINPVQWANEAIPFSFVADWFSNLSSVIGALTDFAGLNLRNPVTTHLFKCRETFWMGGPYGFDWEKNRNTFIRTLEIPQPKLHFEWERFSWQRGLNAISLLVGFLPRTGKTYSTPFS